MTNHRLLYQMMIEAKMHRYLIMSQAQMKSCLLYLTKIDLADIKIDLADINQVDINQAKFKIKIDLAESSPNAMS